MAIMRFQTILGCVFAASLCWIAAAESSECSLMPAVENGNIVEIQVPTHVLHYSCNLGYRLEGPDKLICSNGTWSPSEAPKCVPRAVVCLAAPSVLNARVEYNLSESPFPKAKGSMATIVCASGYSNDMTFQTRFVVICGPHGLWTMPDGSVHLQHCTRKHCTNPPEVPRALYKFSSYNPMMTEGLEVEYICSNGYELLDPASARLTCRNGQWEGPTPTCVLKESCQTPDYIHNGKWSILSKSQVEGPRLGLAGQDDAEYPMFEVGAEVEYICDDGFKLVGPKVLQCRPSRIWSRAPPICIPESESTWYCPDLGQIKNGFCKCVGEDSADLQLCMPFHRGTRIECTCLDGVDLLTCTHSSSLNIGVWQWDTPRCYKDSEPGAPMDMLPDGENDGKSYNSGDISDGKNKVSSVVIVVTTACSVLGVLLLIMVIVVFRRKKPRAPLFQQGPAPPPYSRVHNNSLDEHDRLALMAYADASRVHLPSYEEAVRPGAGGAILPVTLGPGVSGHGTSPTSEYRRLPNVYPAVRASIMQQQQHNNNNMVGDGNNNINNNNNNNSNRHSTVTTSTMNRDGVSEIFGSVDTVNVSMSDASTSVTVETYDSGTSNRSMASQRATAGSLTSSDDQLATDDAPLLDSTSQREADVVSVSSNPSRSSKDE
ncbi:uncharacterized protein LOC101855355 [Aplysia californica]|uniref:Uncharacterized protein LOC101855355 n=1 Tax=Aplysia californica TaxID=6500 RepID=A0ABM0JWM7_APLCA|nr:uncharacterized protein LOC101855355 [Aplysia californica]XP_035826916.1 uncharacterized protein LOC101855355 [Aplysia californica]